MSWGQTDRDSRVFSLISGRLICLVPLRPLLTIQSHDLFTGSWWRKWKKKRQGHTREWEKTFSTSPQNALGLGVEILAEFARVLPPLFRCHLWLKNPTKPGKTVVSLNKQLLRCTFMKCMQVTRCTAWRRRGNDIHNLCKIKVISYLPLLLGPTNVSL